MTDGSVESRGLRLSQQRGKTTGNEASHLSLPTLPHDCQARVSTFPAVEPKVRPGPGQDKKIP